MHYKFKLALWEVGCVIWIFFAGAILHFAFELSDYWTPMALIAAVNESAWEHTKMYFWPGLLFALVQYTYTRDAANNYWLGKAAALAITPIAIFATYYGYLAYLDVAGGKASLPTMLAIMAFGVCLGQFTSYKILAMPSLSSDIRRYALPAYAVLIGMFATFTYFPPKIFLFENFFCYEYTGDYGILPDYTNYRVFARDGEEGAGVNYCAGVSSADTSETPTVIASRN
ncbi:MAG: DUF6512 family protein [Gammaproteobacteria bacterium]|nr:DUF6512 family protein [Gammaproteobacteria bacterium]